MLVCQLKWVSEKGKTISFLGLEWKEFSEGLTRSNKQIYIFYEKELV